MKIYVNETGRYEDLVIIDPETNVEWTQDFIGNTGAFNDGIFIYSDDKDAYICDQESFEWWDKVIKDHQKLENRKHHLEIKYGYDAVIKAINNADRVDLENEAFAINEALDEAFSIEE
ncbi:hypothetical protein L3V83_13745 [Thiotrichales bacterium 19X7-9]|nr:hypothetical protein [Thiotrichales bacterium 19X7-9]